MRLMVDGSEPRSLLAVAGLGPVPGFPFQPAKYPFALCKMGTRSLVRWLEGMLESAQAFMKAFSRLVLFSCTA